MDTGDDSAVGGAAGEGSVAESSFVDSEKGGANKDLKEEPASKEKDTTPHRDAALPKLKQASVLPTRLHIPQSGKFSPSSSRNSSISGKTTPPRGPRERGGSYGSPSRSLTDSLDAALGDPAGGRRVLVSASSGINLRAMGSPGSSISSIRDRRGERGKSMPTSGSRAYGSDGRSSLSNRTSPRTSQSPDAKRSSMSFGDFVAASNTELSLLESSRLAGKRQRDRNALRVAVRVRPLIAREKGSRVVACDGGDGRMVVVNPIKFKASADAVLATASAVSRANMATSDWLRRFDFDRVFWSTTSQGGNAQEEEGSSENKHATQESIFEGLGERIVEDALNGFNCSCFAYGHTGSGKTYSMFGCGEDTSMPDDDEALAAPPQGEGFGLVPRICYSLLRRLEDTNTVAPPQEPGTSSVGLSVQFIEIYNDKIRDLLHPGADMSMFRVREHPQTGPYVDNLVPVQVESWSQLRQLLALGVSARAEADTPENSKSSRGHAILTLEICTPSGLSRVQMVDLAGSEREVVAHDGREKGGGGADGRTMSQRLTLSQRLRETAQIKKALSNLGIIIKGLSRGDTPVGLPFRDSILTWLLKEALSGRAHTTMLATVSPSSKSYVETMNTLKYAERLKRANAHLNKDPAGPRLTKPSDGMKKEMESLVEKLGADGVEAKRQVLYQTVSDPQQRIAKLTAKDPRRRRTSSGGDFPWPKGGRRPSDEDNEQRRTSLPGSDRFGWKPSTPSRPLGETSDPANDSTTAWGSPINTPDDGASLESDADQALEDEKHGVGDADEGVASSDDGVELGGAASKYSGEDNDSAVGLADSKPDVRSEEPGEVSFEGEPGMQLYSESESEGREDGVEDGKGGQVDDGLNYGGHSNDDDDSGARGAWGTTGGVSDPSANEGRAPTGPLDAVDGDVGNPAPRDQLQSSLAQSPGTGFAPNWAGTSSSEDADSPGSVQVGMASHETAAHVPAVSEVNEAATVPTSRGSAAPEMSGIHITESSDTYVGGSSDTFFGGPSHTYITGQTAARAEEVRGSGGMSNDSNSGSAAVRTGGEPASGSVPDVSIEGSTGLPMGEVPGAERPSRTHGIDPTAARREELPHSTPLTERVSGARIGSDPSRRITWGTDNTEEESGGARENERRRMEERGPVGGASRDSRRAYGRFAGGSGHNGRQPADGGRLADEGDESLTPDALNSSVESGGGAAALAASGVFDVTGTSAEVDEGREGGISIGDVDSLDGMGMQQGPWARQHAVRDDEGRPGVTRNSSGVLPTDDTRGLIEDLMRQIEELRASNASLAEEIQRLKEELRRSKEELGRSKESEEEAWALGDETAKEFQSRLASVQRDLDEQRARAREAERNARDADARAASALAGGDDASRLVDEAHARMKGAEQRAARAEERERDLAAREEDARVQLGSSQAALEEQRALAEQAQSLLDEAQRRAEKAQQRADHADAEREQLEASASDALDRLDGLQAALEEKEASEAEAKRLLIESLRRAEKAEQRAAEVEAEKAELEACAADADARVQSSQAALEEQAADADEARRLLEESRRQVKEAEQRAARAEAREAELEASVQEACTQDSGSQAALTEETERALEESRRLAQEAEQRAAEVEARAEELEACAADADARVQSSQAALEEQAADADEARRLLEESRRQVKEAEQRAARAEAREAELEARVQEARTQDSGSQAALTEETERALEESRRLAQEAEQRAAGAEARAEELEACAADADARVQSLQAALEEQAADVDEARRLLEESRRQVKEAEQRAVGAEAREAELKPRVQEARTQDSGSQAALTEETERALEESRRLAQEAEQRAAGAEARAEELEACAADADARVQSSQAALEEQAADVDEARRLLEESRRQVKEAEQRAVGAEAREAELEASVQEARTQDSGSQAALTEETERALEESRRLAQEAEQRAAGAEARAEELEACAADADARVQSLQAALEEQAADVDEARRLLEESRRQVKEAEQRAVGAEAREAELEARVQEARTQDSGSQAALTEETERALEESRRLAQEAEQRAAGAEARAEELEACAADADARVQSSQAALEEQAADVDEARRLLEESRRQVKEAEQRAVGAEAREAELEARVQEARTQDSGSQAALTEETERALEESRRLAQEAEQRAAGAEARAEELEACAADARTRLEVSQAALQDQTTMTKEAEGLLDESRREAREAEQRVAGAEAREKELEALANDARAQLEESKAALRNQMTMTETAERRARQTQAAVEATGSGVDAAVAASQRTAEQEMQRAAQAEARASRAVAKANELASLVDEHEARLRKARANLEEEGARADGAEVRERRAVARAEELEGMVNEKDKHLAKVKQALQVEGARADEIAEGRGNAEYRVRELERETERLFRELEDAKREAKASLDAVRADAAAEVDQAGQQRDAVIEERDRTLEQVEAERTEVLRLGAELNDLREAAEQDANAADEREAALKALLASETEASRTEQVEVEDLLSLILAAQDAGSGGRGAKEPAAVSIPGARVAVETQRAKYEAARRRLETLEDENRALRRSEADAQARREQLELLEEERDFLLQEKEKLVDRLGNLEARQGSFQERERQAKNREGEATLVKEDLEKELQSLKQRLAREAELRAKEAKGFADRLKEKDEEAAEQLGDTLKQVMEGVKSQAGHIRGTVAQLEEERDRAIRGKDTVTKELEDVKCQLEALKKEKREAASDFEEQMKQSARERAALWLAVNKLDVLEAAKDAAIKELQKEGEDKARALKVLQAHNAGLTRELGQVDMSLMQALEDNGLTLDSVRLHNTPISRRLGRRRLNPAHGSANGNADHPPPELEEIDNMHPATSVDARDPVAGNARARDGAASWQRGTNRDAARPPRPQSQSRPGIDLDRKVVSNMGVDRAFPDGAVGERTRTYSGSSFQADRWDPAINTIEREISELSERLDPSRGGKRLRSRGSQGSPPRAQDARKRERGSLASLS